MSGLSMPSAPGSACASLASRPRLPAQWAASSPLLQWQRIAQRYDAQRRALLTDAGKSKPSKLVALGPGACLMLTGVVSWQRRGQSSRHCLLRWAGSKAAEEAGSEGGGGPCLQRRKVAAALVTGAVAATPGEAVAEEQGGFFPYVVEKTIPQQRLVANLGSAEPRTVIITGSNSGIGLAGAKLLVASGHRVICACRTLAKAEKAVAACEEAMKGSTRPGSAVAYQCDLADLASVQAFAEKVKSSNERIDTLALNAGLSLNATEKGSNFVKRTADGFEVTIGTNHLGHFKLANLLVPVLATALNPRIVVTASPVHDPLSGGGNVGPPATLGNLSGLESGARFEMVDGREFDPDKAYKDSKLCNMLFMAEASRRYASKGITVNAFSPGLIADPEGFFRNQNSIFANVFNQISRVIGVAETNEFGGSALAYMAVDPELQGLQGGWYDSYPPGKHQLAKHVASAEARDVAKQAKLWDLSAKLTGLA